MEKLLNFSLDDISLFQDDDDQDFSLARFRYLADGNNSHKNPISLDVLKRDAHTALGKFVIGKYDPIRNDTRGHEATEEIYGYIPPNGTVSFEQKDGKTFATVDGVLSKLYATPVVELFKSNKKKAVSCEFTAQLGERQPNGDEPIEAFTIRAITILGQDIRPSCKGAEVEMMKFSECDAEKYYNRKHDTLSELQRFSERRKQEFMAEKTYKVNKTELKETAWGDVDKISLRNAVMGAKNKSTLVHDVYALVEDGWEESPSEHLKYPIMELSGDTFYYNRYGLASALAYAKQENETEVVSKVMKLYKNFKLDDGEGEKKEMEEKKEYPENDAHSTDEKDKKEVEKDDEEEKKMSLDANADMTAYYEMLENETDEYKELAKRVLEDEDRGLVMQDVLKMAHECDELKQFKDSKMTEMRDMECNKLMAEVKDDLDEKQFEDMKAECMACKYEDVTGIANKYRAMAYARAKEKMAKENKVEEPKQFARMGFDFTSYMTKSDSAMSADEIFKKYL